VARRRFRQKERSLVDSPLQPFPVHFSVLRGDALERRVLVEYNLQSPVRCGLLNRRHHDNYLVTTGNGQRFVLRLHQHEPEVTQEAVEEQAAIVAALGRAGLPVELPIPRRDGSFVQAVQAPEGVRYTLLVRFVEGATVAVAPTEAQAEQYGETAARMHAMLDQFGPQPARPQMNLAYLLQEPLRNLLALAEPYPAAHAFLAALGDTLRVKLGALALPMTPPVWGLCHGDLHKRNVLFNSSGTPTLMDWDCLGYSWRAYDLASMRRSLGRLVGPGGLDEIEAVRLFGAFLSGYTRVRPLSIAEITAIAYFVPIRHIWIRGTGVAWALRTGWHPSEFDHEWYDQMVTCLRSWMEASAG
jgi:Ser/Thr protein kinase RdoA (MazF antagonist)